MQTVQQVQFYGLGDTLKRIWILQILLLGLLLYVSQQLMVIVDTDKISTLQSPHYLNREIFILKYVFLWDL